ncbi:unnamed protein product [Vitrella brassicaformis CCMP3155]|uniref:Uncharacterized protein n=2 Tax=Vitrella brassicaformis TaxID=1169539 RepID=A0A0G4EQP5_VITBC|nr:unnamed protein product [Vitrella brassicaformis CCMP3155]|eukprot:CEL99956.1 unnamed protein product [Vitrella brassicaformis CCMP3155]
MAERLARIIGTEEDRVNCPFYWKIGACRHGDQCSRAHYKPTASQTLVLRHMYQNPPVALAIAEGQQVTDDLADQAQDHFEAFYEEVFAELANYGEIEEMTVCDNIGDHMIGNVYIKYVNEDDADKALKGLTGRFYAGKAITAEFCPVTDFREARCRQFVEGQCTRGGYCNFMHTKHVPRSLKRKLFKQMYEDHPDYRKPADTRDSRDNRDNNRDREAPQQRSRSRERYRDRDRDRDRRDDRRGGYNDSRGYRDSRGGGDRYNRDRQNGDTYREKSSQERRAMVEQWNREREGGVGGGGGATEDDYRARARQTSEERRAMVAKWNRERDEVTVKHEDGVNGTR